MKHGRADVDDSRWQFDFTTIMLLMAAAAFLPLLTWEIWLPHH